MTARVPGGRDAALASRAQVRTRPCVLTEQRPPWSGSGFPAAVPLVRGASHTRLAARDRPRCLRTRPPMLLSPSSGAVVPPRAGPCSGAHPWAASLRPSTLGSGERHSASLVTESLVPSAVPAAGRCRSATEQMSEETKTVAMGS